MSGVKERAGFWARLRPADGRQWLFVGFAALLLAGGAASGFRRDLNLLAPALLAVGLLVAFVEWRALYYLLFLTLPFSQQIGLVAGLTMDVPSEPLLLALTACTGLTLLLGLGRLAPAEWRHPLLLLLALMLLWAGADTFFSVNTTKSVKYLLAKVWYLVPFVLGTLLVLQRPATVWRLAACYLGGAVASVLYVLPRHASRGFRFDEINWALRPFFLNHVIYATMLALLVPFAYYGWRGAGRQRTRWAWGAALGVLLFGLFTSYTRASMLSLPIAGLYYLVLRLRLTRLVLLGTVTATAASAFYFLSDSTFMRYTPDFEKTIFNGQNFEKHLEATYKFEDVSGMERVYRWVAATRMIADKPMVGSGPSTFYPEYQRYTVKSFRTYVSDNPEHSTSHNYFLLQLAEQGFPGFGLFCVFIGVLLLTAERRYHQSAAHPDVRRVVLAASLALVVIIFHLLLNELVEVDKIGSMFFVCVALLVRAGSWVKGGTAWSDEFPKGSSDH